MMLKSQPENEEREGWDSLPDPVEKMHKSSHREQLSAIRLKYPNH